MKLFFIFYLRKAYLLFILTVLLIQILGIVSCTSHRKSPAQNFATSATDTITVLQFGANGNDNKEDSEAFQKAINEASSKGQVLVIPKGKFYVKDVNLKSNTTLMGVGDESIIQKIHSGIFAIGCNFSYTQPLNDASGQFNIKNIRISNLAFKGTSNTDGFSEHKHLLNLNGVEDVLIKNSSFTAFNGDGIYIGSDVGVERHNKNVTIELCNFDGVNKENRNAISVIDGSGINILNNKFLNCTRSNMPGAIDFEPDVSPYHIIRNIAVSGNSFNNIGGNVAAISVVIAIDQQNLKVPVENITIVQNKMENVMHGIGIFHKNNADIRSTSHRITISENTVYNSKGYPLAMYGVGNVRIENNSFDIFKTNIFFGLPGKDYQCYNILFKKNLVKRNSGDGIGISLRTVNKFSSESNTFEDIGMTTVKYGIAILGETNGKSEFVRSIQDILVGDRTTAFTAINPGHVTKAATNEFKKPVSQKNYINFFPFKK